MTHYLKTKTRLWHWRTKNELTLAEVAGLTGLSESMLCRVENGERELAPLTKVKVARRLGVPVRALFDLEPVDEDAS